MRSPVQEDAQRNLLPYSIVKQLRYVPFWSTFWIWFQAMTKDIDFRDLLSIVIPAPDGVFVAHLSKSETALEIRTFIDSKGANTDRKAVRHLMIQVSEPLLESPLSASPAVELTNLDYGNAFLTPVQETCPHSDLLASCLFRQPDHGYKGTPAREAQ